MKIVEAGYLQAPVSRSIDFDLLDDGHDIQTVCFRSKRIDVYPVCGGDPGFSIGGYCFCCRASLKSHMVWRPARHLQSGISG